MAMTVIFLDVTFIHFMLHLFHVRRDLYGRDEAFGVLFEDSDMIAEDMIGEKISSSETLGTLNNPLHLFEENSLDRVD